ALVTRFVIVGMMPWPEGLQRRAHASDIGEPRTLEFVEPREEWKLQPSAAKSSAVMPHVLTATAARLVQTERRIMQVRTGVAPAFPLTASTPSANSGMLCSSYWRSASALLLVAIPTIGLPLLSVEKSSRTPRPARPRAQGACLSMRRHSFCCLRALPSLPE